MDGAAGDGTATGQQQRVGGRRRQLLEMVGDQNRRHLGMGLVECVEGLQKLFARSHIQAGGRLVEQQQQGLGDQRPGDQRAAPLALRQGRPHGVGRWHRPTAAIMASARSSSAALGFHRMGVSIVAVTPVSTTSRTVSAYCS